jgi:hypothetical protein
MADRVVYTSLYTFTSVLTLHVYTCFNFTRLHVFSLYTFTRVFTLHVYTCFHFTRHLYFQSQREAQFEAEARKGMSKEEATFAVEAPIEAQSYLWSDKYRPRKPRYFNRVHTVCLLFNSMLLFIYHVHSGLRMEQVQPDSLRSGQSAT